MDPNQLSNSMDLMLAVMLAGFGVYSIFTYIKYKRTYYLTENTILYPGGCKYQDCLLPGEFLDFILPKVLILGIGMIVFAIALVVFQLMALNSVLVTVLMTVLPVAGLIWYVVMQRKAAKLFW